MGESKIEDFSERIEPVKGEKSAVFWDVEATPFPVSWNPDMIYHKIESELIKMGFSTGHLSIWAYVDEENSTWGGEFLRNKTWKSRIFFLPGGEDKLSRRYRMLNDIFLWRMDYDFFSDDLYAANLIVVSDSLRYDKKFFDILEFLTFRYYYNAYLVTRTQHVRPESSDWPAMLFDEGYFFVEGEGEREDEAEETPEGSVGRSVDQADTS